jgi:hypothetical protein
LLVRERKGDWTGSVALESEVRAAVDHLELSQPGIVAILCTALGLALYYELNTLILRCVQKHISCHDIFFIVFLGLAHYHLRHFDLAIEFLEKSKAINEKVGNKEGALIAAKSLFLCLQEMGQHEKAMALKHSMTGEVSAESEPAAAAQGAHSASGGGGGGVEEEACTQQVELKSRISHSALWRIADPTIKHKFIRLHIVSFS